MTALYSHLQVARREDVFCVRLRWRRIEEMEIHQMTDELVELARSEPCRGVALSLEPNSPECLYSIFLAKLYWAQRVLREKGVGLVLGDVVFEMDSRLHETIALLAEAGAIGVWGNHDLGLCHEPDERFKKRYAGPVFDFMQTLHPRLELGGCLFTHGLPYNDPTDPIAYYLGERPETAEGWARSFAASAHPVLFVGHFHRWFIASPAGRLSWDGTEPIRLRPDERYLVVIAAVCDGWCAVFDTDSREMAPFHLPGATAAGSGGPAP